MDIFTPQQNTIKSTPISEVYLGDCMDYMRQFPDNYFGLAIPDPPYFTGPEKRLYYGNEVNKLNIKRKDYPIISEWIVPTSEFFDEVIRVSKNQIIWGCNYFQYQFGPGRIIWDKCNGESSFSDCEIAYCSFHDSVRMFKFMWNGMLQGKDRFDGATMQVNKKLKEFKIHQTQKPVELYKWCFERYLNSGDKILDTHLGSQSSRIAAYDLQFEFYGSELNETHFDNGCERFERHKSIKEDIQEFGYAKTELSKGQLQIF